MPAGFSSTLLLKHNSGGSGTFLHTTLDYALSLFYHYTKTPHPIVLLGRERNGEEISADEIIHAFRFLKLQENNQSGNPFVSDLPHTPKV